MVSSLVVMAVATTLLATSPQTALRPNDDSFDKRPSLSRSDARQVYDKFADEGHKQGGKDADSGYGGPAVTALLEMADFASASKVLEFGCGQGKLAELVLEQQEQRASSDRKSFHWRAIDQSPKMVDRFQQRCVQRFGEEACTVELLNSGVPSEVYLEKGQTFDRFVSTYCLDLLSEGDMYEVLDLAQASLHPHRGILLLAGITWGYRDSVQTCAMTLIWELLYRFNRKRVGGCRPQALLPYLKSRGWRIETCRKTMPNGFPWMVSEVIAARPPKSITASSSQ